MLKNVRGRFHPSTTAQGLDSVYNHKKLIG